MGSGTLSRGDIIFLACICVPFSIICLNVKQVGYELDGKWEYVEALCPNPGEWENWSDVQKEIWAKRNVRYKPMSGTDGCYRK